MRKVTIDWSILDDLEIGLDGIAHTADPAIEVMGLNFSKKRGKFIEQKRELFSETSEQIIAGPIMMVKDIYRYDSDMGEYEIVFDAPAIKALWTQLNAKLPFLNKGLFNDEHDNDKTINSFIYSGLLIESQEDIDYVKAKYKQDLPLGTAFIACKINKKETYDYLVKNNKLGFSVEGLFKLDDIVKQALKQQNVTIYDEYKNKKIMRKNNFKKVNHVFKKKNRNKFTDMIDEIAIDGGIIQPGVSVEVIDDAGEVIENWSGEVTVESQAGDPLDILIKDGEIVEVLDVDGEDATIATDEAVLVDEPKEEELSDEEDKKEDKKEEELEEATAPASVDIEAILKKYLDQIIALLADKEAGDAPKEEELSDEKEDKKAEAFDRALGGLIARNKK